MIPVVAADAGWAGASQTHQPSASSATTPATMNFRERPCQTAIIFHPNVYGWWMKAGLGQCCVWPGPGAFLSQWGVKSWLVPGAFLHAH